MRQIMPYVTVVMLLSICYAAWVVLSRRHANAELERATERKQADDDRKSLDLLGGGNLKIVGFYPDTPSVHRGQKALICFSVAFAKEVTIEPEIGAIPPSLSRCVEVHPSKTTEYKITAKDAQGHSATQSFELPVK